MSKQVGITSFMKPVSAGKQDAGNQRKISAFFQPKPKATGASAETPGKPKSPAKAKASPNTTPVPAVGKPSLASTPAAGTVAAVDAAVAPSPAVGPRAEIIGRRIEIFWPADEVWYKGTVKSYDADTGKHSVLYDDGETQEEDLRKEKHRLLAAKSSATPAAGAAAAPRSCVKSSGKSSSKPAAKGRRVIMSDDEDDGPGAGGADEESGADDSGSEFDAEAEEDDDSDDDVDLADEDADEDEGGDGDADLEDDMSEEEDEGAAGRKRRRGGKAAAAPARKKQAVGGGAATPAPAGTAARSKTAAAGTPAGGTTPTPITPFGHLRAGGAAAAPPSTARPATAAPASKAAASLHEGATPYGARSVTPQSHPDARKKLHSALDVTPAAAKQAPQQECVAGVAANLGGMGEDSARFLTRMSQRFPFLHPDRIMDAQRRKPTHADYDPRTLYVPPNWFKEAKVSEGQQQWWAFKASNFDSVLLFKMGKFYEMFEMDAFVGVDVLGLQFMKGDQPHAGFPEVRYHDMAEGLARAGYRVVVVEQTETPDMLKERNEQRRKQGLKQVNVVNREKVAVLTKGTLIDAEMVASKPDASYVLALCEMDAGEGVKDVTLVTRLGMCAVDVASGQIIVGEFYDDEVRSCLRTHLTSLQPVELVLPKGGVHTTTSRVLRAALRGPRINELRGEAGQWEADGTLKELLDRQYYTADGAAAANDGGDDAYACWPAALAALARAHDTAVAGAGSGEGAAGAAALRALGGAVNFLRDALLDRAVLPLGRVEALAQLNAGDACDLASAAAAAEPTCMLLNGAALENLEVLENADGCTTGTLLAVLDHCTTPFGRRRLRQWLCRPLFRVSDIEARQDAVAALMGPATDAVGRARKHMAGISDLERAVARLHASTVSGAAGRDACHVVLYEDAAKRKVKALVGAVRDLQAVHRAVSEFASLPADELGGNGTEDSLLQRLVANNRWQEVEVALNVIANAADWSDAEQTGRVLPAEGVDDDYDAAMAAVRDAETGLQAYLKEVRSSLGGSRDITYIAMNKDTHVLEVPDHVKVGKSFDLVGTRKGFHRYMSEELKGLVADLGKAKEGKEAALANILQALVRKFVSSQDLWLWAVESVAELDALMSLASHAMHASADGPVCRPQLLPYAYDAEGKATQAPVFEAQGMRHPAGLPGRSGAFVPNDIRLGGDAGAPFIVLTGPNMGGKSTLLRQSCLAALLAQVGACVPAQSLRLTPVDAVYVRMGAKDHIMTGQSTFYVELAETAAMLNKATHRSLVALDELGRGTATLDGAAIAGAVLTHMAHTVGCRGLFATHYHHLSSEHENDPRVAIMHMACGISGGSEEDMDMDAQSASESAAVRVPEVTFLYKLTPGACPRSYGTNVARLAGLPEGVVQRAAQMSAQTEVSAAAAAEGVAVEGAAMEVDGAAPAEAAAAAGQQQQAALQQGLAAAVRLLRAAVAAPATGATPCLQGEMQKVQQAAQQLLAS